jgi:hypothetical protein
MTGIERRRRTWPAASHGWLILIAAGLLAGPAGAAEEPSRGTIAKEESWQVILISGQRIGYARSLVEPFERDGERLVRSLVETRMTIKRFGQTLRMATTLQTEETRDGDLRRFTFELANPPATSTKTTGVVQGRELRLENEVAGRKSTAVRPWDANAKSPAYQDRVLRERPLKPGDSLSFEAFLPEFGKVATIKMVAEKEEPVTLLDGESKSALRVRIAQSLVPGLATIGWLDANGETLKSSTNMLGSDMVTYTVSREEALQAIDTQELDLAVSTLVKVRPIPGVHERNEITYRIHIPDQNPLEFLAAGDAQAVKKLDDHTAELTIRAIPIPERGETSASPGAEYLQSSEFLQADDANVRRHAEEAAGTLTDPAHIAAAMEKYVRDKLEKKNFSTALASAAEVAEKLEGDCTEHAVLLAAMLRAKGIPSRVAVGIVYVDVKQQPSFGGHMWTEAWLNGKWVALDGTLGRGGTRAGHIKLGDSSFSDDNATPISTFAPLMLAIGSMRIEVVE